MKKFFLPLLRRSTQQHKNALSTTNSIQHKRTPEYVAFSTDIKGCSTHDVMVCPRHDGVRAMFAVAAGTQVIVEDSTSAGYDCEHPSRPRHVIAVNVL